MFRLSLLAAVACAVATLALLVRVGSPEDGTGWLLVLVGLLGVLSYVLLARLAWRFRSRPSPSVAILVGVLVIGGASLYLIYDEFYAHLRALSGVIFLALPPLQLIATGLLTLIAKAVDHHTRGAEEAEPR